MFKILRPLPPFSSTNLFIRSKSTMQSRIQAKLQLDFNPILLKIKNDSAAHRGHAGVEGDEGGETHFSVEVVSNKFDGLKMLDRHRMINAALKEEFDAGLHALVIKASAPKL